MTKVKLAEITLINPTLDKLADENQQVAFVPMASVLADPPQVQVAESRTLSSVKSGFSYFQDGDILVAKITPCFENGKIAQARIEFRHGFGSTEFHVVRPKADQIDGRYLLHFLRQNYIRRQGERRMTGSAGQRRVPKVFLESLEIYLPSIAEQKRIAAILDKADELRELRRQALWELDAIVQSIFIEMFGDPVNNPKQWIFKTLGDVLDLITYGLTVRPKYVQDGIPLISAKEIRSGTIDFETAAKISLHDFNNLSDKAKPVEGDILFSKTGSIGHCALVSEKRSFAVTQNAARISFRQNLVDKKYALYYFREGRIQSLAQSAAKGNAVKDLQLGKMKEFPFPMPPLPLQQEFAKRVEVIEQLKITHRESLDQLDALFASLQHRAFRGEL
ncbi:restriction endonuclease subunit S [Nodosilinea sp. E11]|uniref:restriction endonuclease subunit S n=1 Tax=Nodosilinea sp. E11 TaxID=3037479 RepID=UPI002934C9B5|nr:restriction endonuclease subunit S [Nodosilinea sp. E11]WOD37336.1 restriction endonuclease subunit S [Nodosilinea sp. E11]